MWALGVAVVLHALAALAAEDEQCVQARELQARELQAPQPPASAPRGIDVPASWEFFPSVTAAPLYAGPATLSLSFRPYTAAVAAVSVAAPANFVFARQCSAFSLIPVAAGVSCAGDGARSFSIGLVRGEFSRWVTYVARLTVVQSPLGGLPVEDVALLTEGVAQWQVLFNRNDTTTLAFTQRVPGYPVWPGALDFVALQVLSRAQAPFPPASRLMLNALFAVPSMLGVLSSTGVAPAPVVEVVLYGPSGFVVDCDSVETERVYRERRIELRLLAELSVASATCANGDGAGGLPLLRLRLRHTAASSRPLLEAGGRYVFEASADAPTRPARSGGEASRTWYLSARQLDPPAPWLPSSFGDKLVKGFGTRSIEASLAIGSAVLRATTVLWVVVVFQSLLSSPGVGPRAWIELSAPSAQGFAFTSPCSVGPALHSDTAGALALPDGAGCERQTEGVARVLVPSGSSVIPQEAYAFLVRSIEMPTQIGAPQGRRLASASVWSVTSFDPAGTLLDQHFPQSSEAQLLELVEPLNDFGFNPLLSSSAARRFEAHYVAAFTFEPPVEFDTPVPYIRIVAPSTFAFEAEEDCSPDSTAPALRVRDGADAVDRALLATVALFLPGWCRGSSDFPGQVVETSEDGRTDILLRVGLQSAVLSSPKPLTDFSQRYLFRVWVRHPSQHVVAGETTWSLSFLDASMRLRAQATGLDAYQLVGNASVQLLPLNRVLSSPSRTEVSSVAVSFRLSSSLPAQGSLLLKLGGGAGENESFAFPEEDGVVPAQGCFGLTRQEGLEVLDGALLPESTAGECSGTGELRLFLRTQALAANVKYVFWITVVNPLSQAPVDAASAWALQTFGADGAELDANLEVPTYVMTIEPLPLYAISTSPVQVLADRTATALLFFELPNDERLPAGSEIRVFVPEDFRLVPAQACEPIQAASADGVSSITGELMAAAAERWAALGIGAASGLAGRRLLPLPPFVDCSVAAGDASSGGRDAATLRVPTRLRGGAPYVFGIDALCPGRTPSAARNQWRLQIRRLVNSIYRTDFDLSIAGFSLVPRLRDERITPFRSLNDGYLKQSRMLPEAASFVSVRYEFQVPFFDEQLKQSLQVGVTAPEGFQLGLATIGGADERTCTPVELLIGREPLPVASWVTCTVVSPSLQHLVVKIPPTEMIDKEATSVADGDWRLLRLIIEAFPLLPPGSTEDLDKRFWNLYVSSCDGGIDSPLGLQNCETLAASTDLPTWPVMFGYLHVDRIVVDYAGEGIDHVAGVEDDWLSMQQASAGPRLAVLQFQGVRLSMQLDTTSSLRVLAPSGYELQTEADTAVPSAVPSAASLATTNLPPLDAARCRVRQRPASEGDEGGQTLVLFFVAALDGDQLFDLAIALLAPSAATISSGVGDGADSLNLFRVETRSDSEALLDVQRDVGQWDRSLPFDFTLLAARTVGVPGDLFDMAVFFRMPADGLGTASALGTDAEIDSLPSFDMLTSLRLEAPPSFEFARCDGAVGDNARLSSIPTALSLEDTRVLPALLTALPAYSACAAYGSELSISLGGRRRGSGRGVLHGRATYAFSWPVRVVVGRQLPYRPRGVAGVAGEATADLIFGDEPATPESMLGRRARWTVSAYRGPRRIFTSRAETYFEARSAPGGDEAQEPGLMRLEVRDLSPVWTIASAPYFGQRSLVYVIFSLGHRAYPSRPLLRLSLKALDPVAGQSIELLSCEEQAAAFRRQGWEDPLAYFSKSDSSWGELEDRYLEFPERASSAELQVVSVESGGCTLEELVAPASTSPPSTSVLPSNGSNDSANATTTRVPFDTLVRDWRTATSLQMTLQLNTMLIPPAEQYMLVLAVQHRERQSAAEMATQGPQRSLLTLEVLDGRGTGRALARSHDLATYPVVGRITLVSWAYSSNFSSAENQLDLAFRPATTIQSSQDDPAILGFVLVAPITFRFTERSCDSLELFRSRIEYNIISEVNETKQLFFAERPTCEVARSEWLSDTGYYQNQLVVYMPALVEMSAEVYYRVRVLVLNPPVPFDSMFLERAVASKPSPRLSLSPHLAPLLRAWRLFTFVWPAGDAGGGEAPFIGASASASLGRVAGVRKVDEVTWPGIDILPV